MLCPASAPDIRIGVAGEAFHRHCVDVVPGSREEVNGQVGDVLVELDLHATGKTWISCFASQAP